MSREDWVTICNVRTLADHYEAIAAGKKDSYSCNPGEIAEALRSASDMLERLPQWISVEERLPPLDKDVLLMCGDEQAIGGLDEDGDFWGLGLGVFDESPTHWMPLPAPPTDTK